MLRTTESVEAYLEQVPEPARTTLGKLRKAIRAAVPKDAIEKIGYGLPAFYFEGRGLIAYGYAKKHCALYPMSGSALEHFPKVIAKYDHDKGTLRFPHDHQLPAAFIKALVKFRVAQNRERNAASAAKKKQ